MLAQAVAGALDLDDDGVVKEAIEQRGSNHRITEDLTPFGEAAIRGEDHGALFVAGIDELEEQVAAARGDRQITDLIDDQYGEAAEEADFLAQTSLALCLRQGADDIGERGEVDTCGRL